MTARLTPFVCLIGVIALGPVAAFGQSGGNIAGVVRDTTGAVLPGVTVEAASPALIEKTRSAVTDSQGQYKIVDLRPGPYTVTFTLPGFSSIKREGLELNTGVTLPVDGELRVGSIEETVTVSGASPVVDVQNVRTQNVLTREVLDTVPTARNYQAYAALTLGASIGSGGGGTGDVGGSKGETYAALTIHGAGEGLTTVDGMLITTAHNTAGIHRYQFNQLAVQEITLGTGGTTAESMAGGINVNMVPKDGGNTVRGAFNVEYTNNNLQGDNINDELRARGLTTGNAIRRVYDVGAGVGGPLKRDKLWFFAATRANQAVEYLAGVYFNKTQNTLFYTPDPDRPAYHDNFSRDVSLRLTLQATQKQKFAVSGSLQDYCQCFIFLANQSPEATYHYRIRPNNLFQALWNYPVTNRLLFEAGYTLRKEVNLVGKPDETGNARSISELSTGMTYGSTYSGVPTSRLNYGNHGDQGQYSTRFVTSYITGSHALKAGVTTLTGQGEVAGAPNDNVQYVFRNALPVSLNQVAFPHHHISRIKVDLGLFAQDQWTIQNLTLNLGVRFDYLNDYNPAQTRPATEYTPEFSFAAVNNVPNWKDINPRLGASYDLFRNGKTAIKGSMGRYVNLQTTAIANATNPAAAIAAQTGRTWSDANGDYVPDCNLYLKTANGECGAMDNQLFGSPIAATQYATDVTEGWFVRPYHWQISASIQHELRPGISLTAGYFRTWQDNFSATDNLAVTPADFDPFCVTAPVDSRLPGGGGYQLCDLYDVKPAKFGQVNNLVVQTSHYGERTQTYNGFEVSVNARFGRGGLLTAGLSTGQTTTDNCATPDAPQQFCLNTMPFSGQTQVKMSGAYPLPWGLQASGTFQNLPGAPIAATYVATNAEIAPTLGRNLAACGGRVPCTSTATITLFEPNTQFEARYTLLDFRLSKVFRVGPVRIQPRVDLYNLLNAASVFRNNGRYGPTYLRPIEIFGARLAKFGAQIDF